MNMGNKLLQLWKRPWFEDYKIQAFLNSNWDHKTRYKYPAGLAQLGERQAEEEKKKKKKYTPNPRQKYFLVWPNKYLESITYFYFSTTGWRLNSSDC